MPRSIRRVAVVTTLALLAGLSLVSTGSPAGGQAAPEPDAPVLERIVLPEGYVPPTTGSGGVSPAHNPGAEVATSPEANGGVEGTPLGTESVIGPDGRTRVTPTTGYPARAVGQIEGFDDVTGGFTCTGWLIDQNTVLTSGHCVHPQGTASTNFAESLEFFAGRNGPTDPQPGCDATNFFTPTKWSVNESEYADWALIQLDCTVGDTVGWFGFFSVAGKTALRLSQARVQGYPGDKPDGTQWGMTDRIEASQTRMVFYDIDTSAGQSGSPVWRNRPVCGGPCGMAVHSYGNNHGTGPHVPYNHGPRITNARFCLIADLADNNEVP